jgi:uncharacterized membrane protein
VILPTFVWLAVGAGLFWAVDIVFSKVLLGDQHSPRELTVVAVTAGVGFALLVPVAWAFSPLVSADPFVSLSVVAVGLGSGLLYVPADHLYTVALDRGEASRIAPLMETAPVFTLVVAFVVLREVPAVPNVAGVGLVVVGAVLVSPGDSCKRGSCAGNLGPFRSRALWIVVAASILYALFAVTTRVAIQSGGGVWWVYFWSRVGGVVPLAVLAVRGDWGVTSEDEAKTVRLGSRLRVVRDSLWRWRDHQLHLLLANEGATKLGLLLATAAFASGQAALVDAATATAPMFVMAMVLGLDGVGVLDEDVSPPVLAAKTASSGVILVGVFLISL